MPRIAVERADALLEREQALVDFRTLQPRLAVVVKGVCAPLAARKVDEADLAHLGCDDGTGAIFEALRVVELANGRYMLRPKAQSA